VGGTVGRGQRVNQVVERFSSGADDDGVHGEHACRTDHS
jgi:hypothetical protein